METTNDINKLQELAKGDIMNFDKDIKSTVEDFRVVWSNPDEFTIFFKTLDGGNGISDAEFLNENAIEFNDCIYKSTSQTKSFLEFIKKENLVYKDFFEKHCNSIKYHKHDTYTIYIKFEDLEGNEISESIGYPCYTQEVAEARVEIELNDNPLGWLDDIDNQKFLNIYYKKTSENVEEE